ncbi:hypothetical protein EDB81DRAFT_204414 [Dactylonectria macrodidyma]|uniref:Uncharacterized protein n=1 Tax=Dactylonectria macrodidyma TaxID=307937 RepID=A0A9P9DW99_9HYPO|nr:hypothetical protein EDB81DRAFT_204414 [Dactylonectria macrodidyma]
MCLCVCVCLMRVGVGGWWMAVECESLREVCGWLAMSTWRGFRANPRCVVEALGEAFQEAVGLEEVGVHKRYQNKAELDCKGFPEFGWAERRRRVVESSRSGRRQRRPHGRGQVLWRWGPFPAARLLVGAAGKLARALCDSLDGPVRAIAAIETPARCFEEPSSP